MVMYVCVSLLLNYVAVIRGFKETNISLYRNYMMFSGVHKFGSSVRHRLSTRVRTTTHMVLCGLISFISTGITS